MAGSIHHVIHDNRYTGADSLENVGDFVETIEEFAFVLLRLTTEDQRAQALKEFYACRKKDEWPVWWSPETSFEEGEGL